MGFKSGKWPWSMVVLCLLAVVCNVAGDNADAETDNNMDSFADAIEETYTNALRLGVGIIIAIVIGAVAAVVILIVLCGCCCYHCCCKTRPASRSTVVVTQTPGQQPGGMLMQQPVTYEQVNGQSGEQDAVPPYPDQQASYRYVKF